MEFLSLEHVIFSEANKKKAIDIAGLFFTVDPERDTAPRVKNYILGDNFCFFF